MFKSIWYNWLGGRTTPWADVRYVDGQMKVENYNQAFVKKLREKFSTLVDETTSDTEVVSLFSERETIEREEPRLDIKHSGITEDGRIKMELDWNTSFIRHLAENGITGETEEEAVQKYMAMITSDVAESMDVQPPSTEEVDEAFKDIDAELAAEFNEAEKAIKSATKRRMYK